MDIKENVPLAPLTTFKIGGSARYFVDVRTEEEIRGALQWAKEKNIRFVVLAGKSNVLVPDEGIDALVIHIVEGSWSFNDGLLSADAGCNLLTLIRGASEQGMSGWEKLAGIPGTLGGAVRGNAGAFGPEIKDFVIKIHVLHTETGEIREFGNFQCEFSYRMSHFKLHPEWIIIRVWLKLEKVDPKASERLIDETIKEREKRHIQNVQAAGSFFVNPVVPKEKQKKF